MYSQYGSCDRLACGSTVIYLRSMTESKYLKVVCNEARSSSEQQFIYVYICTCVMLEPRVTPDKE